MLGHLNSLLAWGVGDLNKKCPKIQMPRRRDVEALIQLVLKPEGQQIR